VAAERLEVEGDVFYFYILGIDSITFTIELTVSSVGYHWGGGNGGGSLETGKVLVWTLPICVQTVSVRAPMNCGVAFRLTFISLLAYCLTGRISVGDGV
jgi:hypothetical protein